MSGTVNSPPYIRIQVTVRANTLYRGQWDWGRELWFLQCFNIFHSILISYSCLFYLSVIQLTAQWRATFLLFFLSQLASLSHRPTQTAVCTHCTTVVYNVQCYRRAIMNHCHILFLQDWHWLSRTALKKLFSLTSVTKPAIEGFVLI